MNSLVFDANILFPPYCSVVSCLLKSVPSSSFLILQSGNSTHLYSVCYDRIKWDGKYGSYYKLKGLHTKWHWFCNISYNPEINIITFMAALRSKTIPKTCCSRTQNCQVKDGERGSESASQWIWAEGPAGAWSSCLLHYIEMMSFRGTVELCLRTHVFLIGQS